MVEVRWLRVVGPLVASVAFAAAVGSATIGASGARERPWDPPPCRGGSMARILAARSADPEATRGSGTVPRVELVPRLDPSGTLIGEGLTFSGGAMGGAAMGAESRLDLPAESFAAGPFGDLFLVGSDDGHRSRLRAVDVQAGCAWDIGDEADVIRRATLSPDGITVYETRVDRASRADLGVWYRRLDDGDRAVRVLEPIVTDDRFGRTWSTEFAWSVDGDRLAIQSCGAVACRTRVLDPRGGLVQTITDPADGPMIGLTTDRLIGYRACRGLPCPLVSTDLETGRSAVLSDAATAVVVSGHGPAVRVIHEWQDALGDRRLRSVDPLGRDALDIGRIPPGSRLDPDLVLRIRDGSVPTIDEVTR